MIVYKYFIVYNGEKMSVKTNVMRILDQKKIKYKHYEYEPDGDISGQAVAKALSQNPKQVYKTLVTVGKSGDNYVFVIPVYQELDLKKAAKAVGEKSVAMIKAKELLPLTGYVHGGCSPIGMKKPFTTTFDCSAEAFPTIIFSAGKIGYQVELSLDSLKKVICYSLYDLVVS
jgi:Cys-tRNA(Pro)/Cys-tRNA(Cys) deacylase